MNVTKNVTVSSFNWPRRRDEAEVGYRPALGVATEKPSVSVEDKCVLEFFFSPKQRWTTCAMQIVLFLSVFVFLFFVFWSALLTVESFNFFYFWGSVQTVGCLGERVNVAAVVFPAKKTTWLVYVEMTRCSSDTQTPKKCSWFLRRSPPAALVCI